MIIQRRIKITGRVQGVFYRASAKQIADSLDITGWISNEPDGSVVAYASGEEENMREFITWCRNGPQMAIVNDVHEENYVFDTVKGFAIKK